MKKILVFLLSIILLLTASLCLCTDSNDDFKDDDDKEPTNLLELNIDEMEYRYKFIRIHHGNLIAPEGTKFLVITITIKNLDNNRHKISSIDFSLDDTSGNSYTPIKEELELSTQVMMKFVI